MANKETYSPLRSNLERFDFNNRKNCFCKGYGGSCCKADIVLVDGDKAVILNAITNGHITTQVLERAKEKAENKTIDSCPFLTEENKCDIYEYRPLECILYGNGGVPKNGKAYQQVLSARNGAIHLNQLYPRACERCIRAHSLNERVDSKLVSESIKYRESIDYQNGATPMSAFVLYDL